MTGMRTNDIHYTKSGVSALIGLAAVYGVSIVAARYLSSGIGIFEQWYLRDAIACLLAIVVFYRQISLKKFLHLPWKEWVVLLFRVLVGQVIAIGVYTIAVQRTAVGLVAIMEVLPMTALLGVIIFREKLSWSRGGLLLLSFIGAAIVVINVSHGISLNFGALLALVSLVLYALMLVTRRLHTGVLNNQEISVAMAGIAAVITYALSLILYHRWIISSSHWSNGFTLALVAAGCLSMLSNFLGNYGFEHVSAVIAGNILVLEEVFGPLFGFLFYSQILTSRDVIGGLIILASVVLLNTVARREQQSNQVGVAPE